RARVVATIRGLRNKACFGLHANVVFTHQPRDAVLAHRNALSDKLAMNARRAIGSAALKINGRYLLCQVLIANGARGHRPTTAGEIATPADLQRMAHRGNGRLAVMLFELGDLHGCSLAKYAAAFFKMSRSSLSRSFSRWSCLICFCKSDSSVALRGPCLRRCSRNQYFKVSLVIPRLSAACSTV